jgi:hypothetical protein
VDSQHSEVLGKLLKHYGGNIKIHFYKEEVFIDGDMQIQLLARIKTLNGKPIMFYHLRNAHRTYSGPEELHADTPLGKTLIYLFGDFLWKNSDKASEDEKKSYIETYEKAMEE